MVSHPLATVPVNTDQCCTPALALAPAVTPDWCCWSPSNSLVILFIFPLTGSIIFRGKFVIKDLIYYVK